MPGCRKLVLSLFGYSEQGIGQKCTRWKSIIYNRKVKISLSPEIFVKNNIRYQYFYISCVPNFFVILNSPPAVHTLILYGTRKSHNLWYFTRSHN